MMPGAAVTPALIRDLRQYSALTDCPPTGYTVSTEVKREEDDELQTWQFE